MTYGCTSSSSTNCNEGPLGPSLADACNGSSFFVFMSVLNSLIRANDKISEKCERVKSVETPDEEYDFVVIGGGAAGSVVAARLSEIPNWKVLLLEAGPDEPAGAEIPSFTSRFLSTEYIWDFKTTNESNACLSTNKSCAWPSGKNLGGNTVHNTMIYLRGNPTDYNNWAATGNKGWSWEEVEKYYIKGEDNGEIDRVGKKHHGTGGPLPVERFSYLHPLGNSILDAADELGLGVSNDLNGDTITGFSSIQATNKNGVRYSSARAYLWLVRNRTNLHVSLNFIVTRLIIENERTVGVEYYKDGELKSVYVTREVVLSSCVVKTPHILLLSGIGPKEHLESVGVDVVKYVPGVGENLHDHPGNIIRLTTNDTNTYDNNWVVAAEYLASQTGPLSGIGSNGVSGLIASNATAPDYPDIQLSFLGYFPACAPGEVGALQSTEKRTIEILSVYLHPKSKGRITLASKDPFEFPLIWANYLAESDDVEGVVKPMRLAMAMIDTEAVRFYNLTLSDAPLAECSNYKFLSDEYWTCVARQSNYPLYHQVGTCKMGPSSDPMAVVDPQLRVHEIKGLRIADNSIMPQVTSGNTVAPAMMIGERAADFIKQEFGHGTCSHRIYGSD